MNYTYTTVLIKTPAGNAYRVLVDKIAAHHARSTADEPSDVMRTMLEETMPLFEDADEISKWIRNEMTWDDVKKNIVVDTGSMVPDSAMVAQWSDCEFIVQSNK